MGPEVHSRERFEKEALPYASELYASALRLTRRRERAEDLVSDVYSKAWKSFDQYQLATNIRAWLYKILTNTFINEYRHQQRAPVMLDLDKPGEEGEQGAGYLYDRIADTHPTEDPEKVLANRFLDRDLQRAIESLPEEFRLVVVLSDVQSFSYQEIADMLDIPIGTVRSRLWRGRRLLQKTLWSQAVETGLVGVRETPPQ
jgi:RNA polymerase sigma-70 factor (ECF subfamily)